MFTVWADSKPVRIESSLSSDTINPDTNKPVVVHHYDEVIPGVDLNDQQKATRSIVRKKFKKYYKNQFGHLFDTALVNAYLYFKSMPIEGFSKRNHHDFRINLARQIISLGKELNNNSVYLYFICQNILKQKGIVSVDKERIGSVTNAMAIFVY
jgi:hypothetical protein